MPATATRISHSRHLLSLGDWVTTLGLYDF